MTPSAPSRPSWPASSVSSARLDVTHVPKRPPKSRTRWDGGVCGPFAAEAGGLAVKGGGMKGSRRSCHWAHSQAAAPESAQICAAICDCSSGEALWGRPSPP
jgi:hypothetical protein